MIYRNRIAIFLWVFAVVWLSMLVAMTHVALRDGLPGESMDLAVAVFGFFWCVGIGLAMGALRQPITITRLFDDGSLELVQRFPLRRVARRFDAPARPAARLSMTTDSDGDPYFVCELDVPAPFRTPARVVEGPRDRCDAACDRINALRR